MLGKGLIKGLKVTIKRFFKKKITESYPEVKPNLSERSRGTFDFSADKCISCELCSRACPNNVIEVHYTRNDSGKKELVEYKMNLSHCVNCNMCVEACPTGAVKSKSDFENSYYDKKEVARAWSGKKSEHTNSENNADNK